MEFYTYAHYKPEGGLFYIDKAHSLLMYNNTVKLSFSGTNGGAILTSVDPNFNLDLILNNFKCFEKYD